MLTGVVFVFFQKRVRVRVKNRVRVRDLRVANRPGMAGIVPELTHGVPCPGRGSFCPGNVKINHRALDIMAVQSFTNECIAFCIVFVSQTRLDLT